MSQRQQLLSQEFENLPDWQARYRHIIQLGKNLEPLAEQYRTEEYKVSGCQSQVWLHAHLEQGSMHMQADSDALIVRGLIAVMFRVYNKLSPNEVLLVDPQFISQLGLTQHLSPSRANGVVALIKQIRYYAVAFMAQKGGGCL